MQRTRRLLDLLQILRRHHRPVTAEAIADELEVTPRTIYRDMAALIDDGVPIRGEAGVGYVLGEGYDLPPLMFTVDEVEAMLIGLSFVESNGDPALVKNTRDARAKIAAVLPAHLRPVMQESPLGVIPQCRAMPVDTIDVAEVRRAIRDRCKLDIAYADANGTATERTVWPLAMAYFQSTRILVAWCELRSEFRHFRTDRMRRITAQVQRYPGARAKLLAEWRRGDAHAKPAA